MELDQTELEISSPAHLWVILGPLVGRRVGGLIKKSFYTPGDCHISLLGMKFQLSSHEEYQEIAVGGQTGGNLGPMGSYRSEIFTKVSSWLELMGVIFG